MKHDVVEDIRRDVAGIKQTADEDNVVCGVVAAEGVAGSFGGPGNTRPVDLACEVFQVEAVETGLEIHVPPARRRPAGGSAARRPREARSFLYVATEDELPVALMVRRVDLLAIQLRQQYQRQRPNDLIWRVREDVADADQQPPVLKSSRVVQAGKRKELHADFRDRSSGL